ncbi:MAG TPA: hypothetical protein VGV14_12610 [Rhodanobacter sp.]|nr:hypothetical protein [Rhodanobacter sp.]
MTLMIVNLGCSLIMTACGLWILTERRMSRVVRIFCALIATGGSVNALGMIAALCNLGNFVYGDIWPGEVIVNIGTSALMMRWTWRTLNPQRHAACPNPV